MASKAETVVHVRATPSGLLQASPDQDPRPGRGSCFPSWGAYRGRGKRGSLLATYPTSFGVPPRFEAHHKVEACLDRAEPTAHQHGHRACLEMQRR